MKKVLLGLTLLFSAFGFSQESEFKFTKDGFTDFVITPCEGKIQSELYKKALDWVAVTFKNPKEVIKTQIENDYLRLEVTGRNLIYFKTLGVKNPRNSKYQIEISFKDGKYKFDIIEISYYDTLNNYNASQWGWISVDMNDMAIYFNKKGEIRGAYKYFPEMIPTYFNELNKSLHDFLISNEIPSKNN